MPYEEDFLLKNNSLLVKNDQEELLFTGLQILALLSCATSYIVFVRNTYPSTCKALQIKDLHTLAQRGVRG